MSYYFAGYYFDKYKHFLSHDYKDYSFKLDLEYGQLYLTRKLFSFYGKHLPFNLSLKYIQPHIAIGHGFHLDTGFPLGFKTNYHVFLEYDSTYNKYYYEDSDGFYHEFVLAANSVSLYYDRFGTGLMLVSTNNGYKVFDDNDNYQLFDSFGRLIIIHQKISNLHSAELLIDYAESSPVFVNALKIEKITDNYGREVFFSYNNNSIVISFNNNDIITLSISNYYLTSLTKNLGDNHTITETFNFDTYLEEIELDNGDTFSLSYYQGKVSLLNSTTNHCYYRIEYYDEQLVQVWNEGGVLTNYDFHQNQLMTQKYNNNTNLSYLTLNADYLSCLIKDTANDETIHFNLEYGTDPVYEKVIAGHTYGYETPYNRNNNIESQKMYLFYALLSSNLAIDEKVIIELKDEESNVLARLSYERDTSFLAAPVCIKESNDRKYFLRIVNTSSNIIFIAEVKLVPLIGDFEVFCSNVPTGGPTLFNLDTPYYLLTEGIYFTFNNNNTSLWNYVCKMSDYLTNEKLFWKNNNSSHFWFNDMTALVDNVTGFSLSLAGPATMTYSFSPKTAQFSYSVGFIADVSFFTIKGKDDCSLILTEISHNSASFPTGYTSFYYHEKETRYIAGGNGYITTYYYDSNYSLKKVLRDDGYVENYNYDINGNLEEVTTSSASNADFLKQQYTYDSNDNMTSESELVGSSIAIKTYSYDNGFGYVNNITLPNSLENIFQNDSVTGERNKNIKYWSSNNSNIQQNNDYVDESTNSFSTGGNTFVLNYAGGEVSEFIYNNQQVLEIEYVPNTYNGFVLGYRYNYFYSNNQWFYTEYDILNRLTTDGYLHINYDDFNNISSANDDAVHTLYPSLDEWILFEHDYYNQLVSVEVEYNNLSSTFEYDRYHRLVSKSSVYDTSYEYYTDYRLENTIKKTTIEDGLTTIVIKDEVDIYSRQTEQSLLISNSGIKKEYEYYHQNTQSNRSNCFIKTISHYSVVNGIDSLNYTETLLYDNMGNVKKITTAIGQSTYVVQYWYDKYSRLIREDNKWFNKSYQFVYDNNGNLIKKTTQNYSTNTILPLPFNAPITHFYSQTYPNRLTGYGSQNNITYDTIGNPLSYCGKTLTWEKGTLLKTVTEGNNSISFDYDGLNQRIRKTINSVITDYKYLESQLLIETNPSRTIRYFYSHNGVEGFAIGNNVFYYEKSIQKDVIAIRDNTHQIVARYIYDAWGNHKVLNPDGTENTSTTFIGNINPIRYRSYYYDTDLEMYWLTTRYYDPETGRFISPDDWSYLNFEKLHGLNLYAYSKNNPVMYYDPSGHFLELLIGFFITFKSITAIVDTVLDIVKLSTNEVKQNQEGSSEIINSYEIETPWVKFFYLTGLKHSGKIPITGSVVGVTFEWECHNIAYNILKPIKDVMLLFDIENNTLNGLVDSAENVNFGSSIFSDDHGFPSACMFIVYAAETFRNCCPWLLIWDFIAFLVGNKK